jgi:peroxiredoxin
METGLYMRMSTRALFLVDEGMIIRYRWVALDPAWEPDMDDLLESIHEMLE